MRCRQCPSSEVLRYCGASLTAAGTPVTDTPHAQEREVAGERRHLTVLFCDLVGSTEISARLDPEEWREIEADYHRVAAEAITRFGGYVAKYLGDGVMAYFGWPEAHDNDAERATRSGLAILEGVAALNNRDAKCDRPKLAVRVGIDTGTVVIGKGGGNESEVFGEAANIAAQVESTADPDSVMVTPAVNTLVSGLFVVEERGAHQLKGVAERVKLYQVMRLSSVRNRLAASMAHGLTPFVGRDDETRLLWSRWQRASDGEGQVVSIVGEAGIGKSRLVRQFRKRLAPTPHNLARMRRLAVFPEHALVSDRGHASTRLRSTRRFRHGEAKRVGTRSGTGGIEASRSCAAYCPDTEPPGGRKVSAAYALTGATAQTPSDDTRRMAFRRAATGRDGRRRLALVRRLLAGAHATADRASSHGSRDVGLHCSARVSRALVIAVASLAVHAEPLERSPGARVGGKRSGAQRALGRDD